MHCSLPLHDVNSQQQHKLTVGSSDMLCTVAQHSHHEVSDKSLLIASIHFKRLINDMCKHAGWWNFYIVFILFL